MKFFVKVFLPAFALFMGLTTVVHADPYADSHGTFAPAAFSNGNTDDGDGGDDALGPPDFIDKTDYTTLGCNQVGAPPYVVGPCEAPLGSLVLNFDDNLCLGVAGDDLIAHDAADNEAIDVEARVNGSAVGSGTDAGSAGVDLTGLADGAPFNQVFLEAPEFFGSQTVPGADVDAVECLSTVDQGDIGKIVIGDDDVDIGTNAPQYFIFDWYFFNNTGVNGGLSALTFFDAVPAEFDLDPCGEEVEFGDAANRGECDNFGCVDGVCDGVDGDVASIIVGPTFQACDYILDTSGGSKGGRGKDKGGNGRNKLEPEFITADGASVAGLDDGEACYFIVYVKTDTKSFPKGRSPSYTPTSCPDNDVPDDGFGEVVLNDGVKVFDSLSNLLLQDDDSLTLECDRPEELL